MSEPHLTHQVVRLEGRLYVFLMNSERAAHQHVLGSLANHVLDFEEVCALKSLEAEEVIIKVPRIINLGVDFVRIVHNVLESAITQQGRWSAGFVSVIFQLLSDDCDVVTGALVETENGDLVGEHRVVWVHDGHVGAGLSHQLDDFVTADT